MLDHKDTENQVILEDKDKASQAILNACAILFRYYDVGAILNRLENLIILPAHCRVQGLTEELFIHNKEISDQSFHIAKHNFRKLEKEKDMRKTTFDTIRTVYPSFAMDINKSLSDSDQYKYLILKYRYKDKFKKIRDYLNNSYSDIIKCDYKDIGLKVKDAISEIIDYPEANELAYMQDDYVIKQIDSIDCEKFDANTKNNIEQIKEVVSERIRKYKSYISHQNPNKINKSEDIDER